MGRLSSFVHECAECNHAGDNPNGFTVWLGVVLCLDCAEGATPFDVMGAARRHMVAWAEATQARMGLLDGRLVDLAHDFVDETNEHGEFPRTFEDLDLAYLRFVAEMGTPVKAEVAITVDPAPAVDAVTDLVASLSEPTVATGKVTVFWKTENKDFSKSRTKFIEFTAPLGHGVAELLEMAWSAGASKGSPRSGVYEIQTDEGIWSSPAFVVPQHPKDGMRYDEAQSRERKLDPKTAVFQSWEALEEIADAGTP